MEEMFLVKLLLFLFFSFFVFSLFIFLIRCEFCAHEVKTETSFYFVSNFEIIFFGLTTKEIIYNCVNIYQLASTLSGIHPKTLF